MQFHEKKIDFANSCQDFYKFSGPLWASKVFLVKKITAENSYFLRDVLHFFTTTRMTSQKNSYPLQKMSRHEEIHGVVLNNGFIVVHDDVDVKGIL